MPHQRPRTGQRRDDEIKVIRTDDIRYPGHEHPLIDAIGGEDDDESKSSGRRLTPARDTGIAVEGRAARLQRHKERNQRRIALAAIAVVAGLLAAAIGWRYSSDQRAASMPLGGASTTETASSVLSLWPIHRQPAPGSDVFKSASVPKPPPRPPTPIFAAYRGLKLRLPVPVDKLTEIGFHQAANSYALRMTSPLPDAKLSKAAGKKGTSRETSTQPTAANAVLVGSVLRMWRSRPGRPDTAADVGARPGTAVLSPVNGTVVKIKSYKLYGNWADFEIHIRPDGFDNVDLVLIHVTDLSVTQGSTVVAGVTQVARVRKLSDKVSEQLADYVKGGGGDHVHVQVNNARDPLYKGLVGAIEPESDVATTTPAPAP
jgi:murein DD-endopeptidase MepM/ murein hydrolase activator NlpD